MAIESIIGPVIGAAVAVSAIWVKEILERRKDSQFWFEETYIRHGTDRLLEYLRRYDVQLVLLLSGRDVLLLNEDVGAPPQASRISEHLPIEALVRVETLLNTKAYTQITSLLPGNASFFLNIPFESRSKVILAEKINVVRAAYECFLFIRQELLKVKIKSKAQVHNVYQSEALRRVITSYENASEKYNKEAALREAMIDMGH
jgi:hypothetical protein